jgi:hypothetical protein
VRGAGKGGEIAAGCLLAILALLALPVGYFTYTAFAPQLLFDETTRYLYQFREMGRTRVSLVPDLFSLGESKAEVEAKMNSAGLERWSKRYGDESNHQVFHLWAGHGIACGYELFIEADYDDQDLLKSATIQQGGACL